MAQEVVNKLSIHVILSDSEGSQHFVFDKYRDASPAPRDQHDTFELIQAFLRPGPAERDVSPASRAGLRFGGGAGRCTEPRRMSVKCL
jgi:hypothetical protein